MIALKSLRAELARNGTAKKETIQGKGVVKTQQRLVSLEMIAVAAIFVWYEGTISTTAIAWIEHAKGAGRLLSRKPEDFSSNYSFSVFRTVRYMMVS
jgi:hypothetical protein